MKVNSCNYSVEVDLKGAGFGLHQNQIRELEKGLQRIAAGIPWFGDICTLRNGVLRYESLSLLPAVSAASKRKVLLVLGNPTLLGVKHGMFFYSREDGGRHGFWGKLSRAGLVRPPAEGDREEEARVRRSMLVADEASPRYSVGITTFYSFPTPGADHHHYHGSAGVEKLFEPILRRLQLLEIRRLLSYPFTGGSFLIFTGKSALRQFYKVTGARPAYWPIRGADSSGDRLAELLSSNGGPQLTAKPLLF